MNIVHAPIQIAGAPSLYKRGMEMRGHKVTVVDLHPTWLGYPADRTGHPMVEALKVFHGRPDVIHYWFGLPMVSGGYDLHAARDLGIRVIMHHCGSDVRTTPQARRFSPWAQPKPHNPSAMHANLTALGGLVDDCLVTESRLVEYVRPYYSRIRHVPFVVDVDSYPPAAPPPPRERPLVVHAPTNRAFKGTDHIIRALEGLDCDLDLVEGVPPVQARERFLQADIVIDQILDGGIGAFAGEMMAAGKPVVAYLCPEYLARVPEPPPIINANPDTLRAVLQEVLESPADFGEGGPEWVRRWHSPRATVPLILDIYRGVYDGAPGVLNLWRHADTGETIVV